MKQSTAPTCDLIDDVPEKDFQAIKALQLYGAKVVIHWTDKGWRYDVRLP